MRKKSLHGPHQSRESRRGYGKVLKDLSWWVLDRRSITRGYNGINKDENEGEFTSVRTTYRETSKFPMTRCLHQGPTLNPYPFALIMDELAKKRYTL